MRLPGPRRARVAAKVITSFEVLEESVRIEVGAWLQRAEQ